MPNRKIISVVMLSMLLLLSGCTGAQETTVDTGSKVQKAVPQENKSVAEPKGLKLINCRMVDTDLAFEKSAVEAEVTTVVDSIKNPKSGTIKVPGVKEVIMDDPAAKGRIIIAEASNCA